MSYLLPGLLFCVRFKGNVDWKRSETDSLLIANWFDQFATEHYLVVPMRPRIFFTKLVTYILRSILFKVLVENNGIHILLSRAIGFLESPSTRD